MYMLYVIVQICNWGIRGNSARCRDASALTAARLGRGLSRFLGTSCCAFGCESMRRLLMLFNLGFLLPLYVGHIPLKIFKV